MLRTIKYQEFRSRIPGLTPAFRVVCLDGKYHVTDILVLKNFNGKLRPVKISRGKSRRCNCSENHAKNAA